MELICLIESVVLGKGLLNSGCIGYRKGYTRLGLGDNLLHIPLRVAQGKNRTLRGHILKEFPWDDAFCLGVIDFQKQ